MKKFYLLIILCFFQKSFAQKIPLDTSNYLRNGMFENASGKIITNNSEKIKFLQERNRQIQLEKLNMQMVVRYFSMK